MIATGIFSFLRSETQRSFGENSYLFFPATRGSATADTDYTVIVPCTAGSNRGKATGVAGLLSISTDGRVFDVAAADVPFAPEPEDFVLYGAAIPDPDNPGELMADPDNPPVKYRLTGADKASFHSHWRLIAELHA